MGTRRRSLKLSALFVAAFASALLLYDAVEEHVRSRGAGAYVKIDGEKIHVIRASTLSECERGLSYREFLGRDEGMLFVLPGRQMWGVWMKDMQFPIDVVWIDGSEIVTVAENVPPEGHSPLSRYSPDRPVDYILEVNAGYCRSHHIGKGSLVEYHLP